MTDTHLWYRLSVDAFFRRCSWETPWQGEASLTALLVATEPTAIAAAGAPDLSETARLRLSVRQFFSRVNWRCKPLSTMGGNIAVRILESPLTASVSDFFQNVNWDGSPEIAVLPDLRPVSPSGFHSERELTLTEFPTLF